MRRQTTTADEEAVDGSEKVVAPAAQEDGEDVVDSSEKAAAPVAQQDGEEAVDGLEKAAAVQEESRAAACTRESSRPRVIKQDSTTYIAANHSSQILSSSSVKSFSILNVFQLVCSSDGQVEQGP
ncbi:hypothetical protein OsJ_20411 [Oryza sativa Japonica Group]|uniref:Uncharacterized protein n=1 Tax=Oryza sativa subsp. japonica TaxID=39947 RepID=B9FRY1_ORYSJ|nr:hypothetical protein OsJ_20411 [Oryza sativa Japonica Group]